MKNHAALKERERTGSFWGRLWLATACISKRKKKAVCKVYTAGVSPVTSKLVKTKFVSYTPSKDDNQSPARGQLWWIPSGHSLAHSCATMMSPGTTLDVHQPRVPEMGVGLFCHSKQEEAGTTSLHTTVTSTSNGSMPAGVHKSFPVDFKSSKTKILLNTLTWTGTAQVEGFLYEHSCTGSGHSQIPL